MPGACLFSPNKITVCDRNCYFNEAHPKKNFMFQNTHTSTIIFSFSRFFDSIKCMSVACAAIQCDPSGILLFLLVPFLGRLWNHWNCIQMYRCIQQFLLSTRALRHDMKCNNLAALTSSRLNRSLCFWCFQVIF